ncbi:phage portal protein [Thioclava kandeliae]|uniref:Phage portal protein n=1 Tax=Thioclava kandeliae TaxID=3070818 RepID=A0ABV1SFB2_9RHOB
MSFMDKALSKFGLVRKSSTVQWTDGRGGGAIGDAGEVVTPSRTLGLSAVWGCTQLVAGTMSSLPFEVYRSAGNLAEPAYGHPLYGVIHEGPNFDQTAVDFWDHIHLSLELWGNAYASITRNSQRQITSLYPIHPEAVAVKRLQNGRIEYAWTDDRGSWRKLDRDVFHVRGPGGNPLGGMSTLRYGVQTFSSALATERAASATFKNGLRPSAQIDFPNPLPSDIRASVIEGLERQYSGAINAGRPFITEGGMKYQQISISPEDAQMLETRQFSIEEICRFFQVPPVLIGHAGSSTAWPTSVEQQMLMFTKFYLRRRVKRIEQAVRQQLLSAEDKAAGYTARINMDGLLRGDSATRAAYYQTMTQIGAMTINEVRGLENMKAVDGGNEPRMQSQNIPITQTEGLGNA